jgi:hypothetical protein
MTAIRVATDEDRLAAADHGRIPFSKLNRMAAAMAMDDYEAATGEVDSVAFEAALVLYIEASES